MILSREQTYKSLGFRDDPYANDRHIEGHHFRCSKKERRELKTYFNLKVFSYSEEAETINGNFQEFDSFVKELKSRK